ncbi:chromosome segregation protein SMC [Woeseia oceani]|uniref:Chromosome partition protein Smc n=1 Tax=Woeseia oceani TaxID=1548547 RepID=A0A193LGJ3_9GAMM|nr:chromosome segregation protein SMC [Woeseia oceani]ANO51484.1 chromosome segregation protein SMC [Woeseia oceani]
MRLSKIKLAGFKSFVDPTTIPFPSNLVGVVGPNGCGKSNVIDAVRWVMGESSASRLRGDSLTDVIFNGSSSRKPIGAASVELLFDNTETTLEGQYANYAEIGIRREVSRDGVSNYYLNGTRCRRKDITGVFLGTGLGPRSYSIIEQGMISRLIEAKPEEMRVFIEEAAGISKYKERRRETSNRIKHTKENLDRLMDLLEEVEKQLKHLDRQAKTAERYGKLKTEERRTVAELLALRLRDLDQVASESEARLAEKETALQGAIAEQRKLEAELERCRAQQSERSDAFNEVQARFYKAGSEIARLEQTIEHAHDLRERQSRDLEQAIKGATEIAAHINQDQTEIEQLEHTLSELMPGLKQARESERLSSQSLQTAEQALAAWQERWNEYSGKANESEQIRNIEKTRIEQIESRLQSFGDRLRKLGEAGQAANLGELKSLFEQLTAQELQKRQARDEFARKVAELADEIRKLREQDIKLAKLADERTAALQEAQSRYASLEAVQKAALGQSDESVRGWLEASGLDQNERVARSIDVENGWERAAETVLGDYLQAVCVNDVTHAIQNISQLKNGTVTLLARTANDYAQATHNAGSLASKVGKAPAALQSLLNSVKTAETLSDAMVLQAQLAADESVITKDGIWLSQNWLRVSRDKDQQAGILAREQEMRSLKDEVQELRARAESAKNLLKDGRNRLTQLEESREASQRQAAAGMSEYSETKSSLDSARYRMDQATARAAAIAEEQRELEDEKRAATEQLAESRKRFSTADSALTELEEERTALESRREELRAELDRVRAQADQDRRVAQDMAIQFESRRSSKESAAQGLERMQKQLEQFKHREQEIRQQLEQGEEPLSDKKKELEGLLEARITIESSLSAARKLVENSENDLRELDQKRMQIDQNVDDARTQVSEAKMAAQEVRVRREGVAEQFAQTKHELESLLAEMDPAAAPDSWEEKLEKVRRRIERLGPINLAAIDEFKEQSERKEYLDSQLKDLTDALDTLEGAIRKIDRETRTRFRETFERIDSGFKRLFPRLFGGGHAYMELTGDDLLSTGVTVMARPPGKRNSTIHLLSGGEKALTAVALVFAIFELNPAPFCMLDEVDAPLDDANVNRFCDIVREMSEKVQFVFITHNKVTMELARQLTGVTMQEPGVSRMVSVDLDEAVKMAAS